MLEAVYRKRLTADLREWREKGWVTNDGAAAILASVEGRRSAFGMAAIVGVLGALLLGLGILVFVAANWEGMPRQFRFFLLIGGMAAAYGVAAMLTKRGLKIFAEAALLVAGMIFAAAIALIGQSYHLAGDFSGALFLFEIGCLGAALLTGSATLTVLALAGGAYWTWLVTVDWGIAPHWSGLGVVIIGGAIATWYGSRAGRYLAVLAFIFWTAVTVGQLAERADVSFDGIFAYGATMALLLWALGSALVSVDTWPRLGALGHAMLWPAVAAILVTLGMLQTAGHWWDSSASEPWLPYAIGNAVIAVALAGIALSRRGIGTADVGAVAVLGAAAIGYALWQPDSDMIDRIVGGIIVIAAAVWVVNLGQTGSYRIGKKTGLAAFGIELVYLYVVTLGTMIDTAIAFLLGGILFIALAYGLYRLDRRLSARPAEAAP